MHHVNKAVIIKLDIRNFFASSTEKRIKKYFEKIGWNSEAADFLTRVTTFEGGLPQGAPTSPRLSNLINYRLDARLKGLADYFSASYTRYADDLTFSLQSDSRPDIQQILSLTRRILLAYGYLLNTKKTKVLRKHQQQRVTGLVVNQKAQLPRQKRRWLRAVEHRINHKGSGSISKEALAGWRNLENMIKKQTT